MSERWRVGRSVGRTLYISDRLVGLMDTPELAAQVVQAVNGAPTITAEDVRAAERAWGAWSELGDHLEIEDRAAFVADYLNRRGERA